jgi:hypothetical protein
MVTVVVPEKRDTNAAPLLLRQLLEHKQVLQIIPVSVTDQQINHRTIEVEFLAIEEIRIGSDCETRSTEQRAEDTESPEYPSPPAIP